MRKLLKTVLPGSIVEALKALRIQASALLIRLAPARSKDSRTVFSEIYSKKIWGNMGDEDLGSSGSGSHSNSIVVPYISLVHKLSEEEGFKGLTFVDLGCGDFNIGKQLSHLSSNYIGVDVVEAITTRNKLRYSSSSITFQCIDIVKDPLPDGDVCFIRQVLQHLSNAQIAIILNKLYKYKWIFITEHYPSPRIFTKPNIDKTTGHSIRLALGSGIYLTDPPFSLNPSKIKEVLSVEDGWSGRYSGSIKTFMFTPR
jgi:hypothetical protein